MDKIVDVATYGPQRGEVCHLGEGWYAELTWTKQNLHCEHHYIGNGIANRTSWHHFYRLFDATFQGCLETYSSRLRFRRRRFRVDLKNTRFLGTFTGIYPWNQRHIIGCTWCKSRDGWQLVQSAAMRNKFHLVWNEQVGCYACHFDLKLTIYSSGLPTSCHYLLPQEFPLRFDIIISPLPEQRIMAPEKPQQGECGTESSRTTGPSSDAPPTVTQVQLFLVMVTGLDRKNGSVLSWNGPKTQLDASWLCKPCPIPVKPRVVPGVARPVGSNLQLCILGCCIYGFIQIYYRCRKILTMVRYCLFWMYGPPLWSQYVAMHSLTHPANESWRSVNDSRSCILSNQSGHWLQRDITEVLASFIRKSRNDTLPAPSRKWASTI